MVREEENPMESDPTDPVTRPAFARRRGADALLRAKMEEAYRQLREALFCEETGLIYDSVSSHDPARRFDHLPAVEEIRASVPNPHGYATGMEDCMLNGGFAIAACILRAGLEPEHAGESADFARRLLAGMLRCAEVPGHEGYVVRGISPRDGRSVYMESSRDQLTLFVYGVWRYFRSPFSTGEEKRRIRETIRRVAGFAESRMRDSFGYNLGRLDGFPAAHLKLRECGPHEAMRLPMLFAAAHDMTGDEVFGHLYQKYYPHGMERSLRFPERREPWWHIELSQMQISLSLCLAVDRAADHRADIQRLQGMVAAVAERQAQAYDFPRLEGYSGTWQPLAHCWRNARRFTVQLFDEGRTALHGGKLYLKGEESPEYREAFDRIRAAGNMAVAVMLAGDRPPAPDFATRFAKSACTPDYRRHTSAALVNILYASYLTWQGETRREDTSA